MATLSMLERVFARREKKLRTQVQRVENDLRTQVKLAENEIADNKELQGIAQSLLSGMDVPPPNAMEVFSQQARYAPLVLCVWTRGTSDADGDSDREDIDEELTQVVMCLTVDRGVHIKRVHQKKLVDHRRFTADNTEAIGKALREMIADMRN